MLCMGGSVRMRVYTLSSSYRSKAHLRWLDEIKGPGLTFAGRIRFLMAACGFTTREATDGSEIVRAAPGTGPPGGVRA